MKKIRKCCVIVLLVVLFPANIFAQDVVIKNRLMCWRIPMKLTK